MKHKKIVTFSILILIAASAFCTWYFIINDRNQNVETQGGASVNVGKGEASDDLSEQPLNDSSAEEVGPIAPTGTFVSNHRPNLSGSPAPSKISSSCTTSPGATCNIMFSKDGVDKSLETKKTDGEGSTYWDWDAKELGLTAGVWKITVSAILNSKTVTSTDILDLVVAQ